MIANALYTSAKMTKDYMLDAKAALIKGDVKESIRLFTQVLEEEPDNLPALFSRATAYLKSHAFDLAIADCSTYLALNSSNEKVYCTRGNAHLGKEDFEAAWADLNKAIDMNPHYPTAYFSRCDLFKKMGEEEQAREDEMVGHRLQKQLSKAFYESQGFMFQEFH